MESNQPDRPAASGAAPETGSEGDDEPLSGLEPESVGTGEEFLFHLYRGSELLQDNCISEAKEELERALSMQPQDVEGQGLLGIVYFRLGLYPRAIRIYQEIVKACPAELTPRVNLALCYIKTGQLSRARRELETVISRAPERKRAWGYLGLVFERMGDLHKARAAFEKAGQEHMVQRMERLLCDENQPGDSDRAERIEIRQAAADAFEELDSAGGTTGAFVGASLSDAGPRSGRWRAIEPGEEAIPPAAQPFGIGLFRDPSRPKKSLPPLSLSPPVSRGGEASALPSELAEHSLLVFPTEAGAIQSDAHCLLVHVSEGFSARQNSIAALLPSGQPFTSSVVMRRFRGHETAEPMGGARTPFVALEGHGDLMLTAPRFLELVQIQGGFVYLREAALVGFASTVRYEHGRLTAFGDEAVSMVQLSGRGVAVFERHGSLRTLAVRAEQPATVRARLVLGWTGRLLTQPLESKQAPNQAHGFVTFSGDGSVFLEMRADDH